ncbi:hypothetical protein HPB48_021076 [Haemaphysalis longicornis]|uniref:Uncharacterized protein n=1 Tax=Haemaphysalis longicornis TaxID=44386 RepID=A0A9J6GZD5_HAELO|nr:hypothetical protein HPB48_021076 [Haemaphysalis longicornis]
MTTALLPPRKPLDTTVDVLHNWNVWKSEFELFTTATKLKQQDGDMQAATFLMAIGEQARGALYTFTFGSDDQKLAIA